MELCLCGDRYRWRSDERMLTFKSGESYEIPCNQTSNQKCEGNRGMESELSIKICLEVNGLPATPKQPFLQAGMC